MKSGAHGRGGVGIDGFLYGTGLPDLPDLVHLGDLLHLGDLPDVCISDLHRLEKDSRMGSALPHSCLANCHHPRQSWSVYFCEIS